jgi:hypothetical protein
MIFQLIDLWRRKEVRVTFSRPIIEIALIAVIDCAMAPLFVVFLPVKLATGTVRSVWNSVKVGEVLPARCY